jgi:hypothetical protein
MITKTHKVLVRICMLSIVYELITIALRIVQSHYTHFTYRHGIFRNTYLNFTSKGKEFIILPKKRFCWPARSCIKNFCMLDTSSFATGHPPLFSSLGKWEEQFVKIPVPLICHATPCQLSNDDTEPIAIANTLKSKTYVQSLLPPNNL